MIRKYPRTHHLEGSRLQPGDEDLDVIPFEAVKGRNLVVEEKVDGSNSGVSFDARGQLRLQSRGHFLTGGPRERHFALFKQWAAAHTAALSEALGQRYVMYGEWLYAKHTVFYTRLPHYFMEFDVLDTVAGTFLDTPRRRELLRNVPLHPVRVIHQGPVRSAGELVAMIGPSAFIEPGHLDVLRRICLDRGLDPARVLAETDPSHEMEGLYVKVEEGGEVVARYKLVRRSFLTTITNASGHWLDRPIVPNQLEDGADLYGEVS